MIGVLELCAMSFLFKEPLPHTLEEIYQVNYNCKNFIPLQKTLATDTIINVNKYFPARRASWPLITTPFDENAFQNIKEWEEKGITPGFLLPTHHLRNIKQFKQIARLRETGAIPIVTIDNTLPKTLEAARYYWCMHGACPAGWYLPNGLDESIENAPEGLYVTATHWYKREKLPIPDRLFSFSGKEILPLKIIKTVDTQSHKNLTDQDFIDSYYFTPKVDAHWQWLGVDFTYDQATLKTSAIGNFILSFGEVSFWIWDHIYPVDINLFSIINENFSWIVFIIAGINILLLFISMLRRRKGASE